MKIHKFNPLPFLSTLNDFSNSDSFFIDRTDIMLDKLPVEILGLIVKKSFDPDSTVNKLLSVSKTLRDACRDTFISRKVLPFHEKQKLCTFRMKKIPKKCNIPCRKKCCIYICRHVAQFGSISDKLATTCKVHKKDTMIFMSGKVKKLEAKRWLKEKFAKGHVETIKMILNIYPQAKVNEIHKNIALRHGRIGALLYLQNSHDIQITAIDRQSIIADKSATGMVALCGRQNRLRKEDILGMTGWYPERHRRLFQYLTQPPIMNTDRFESNFLHSNWEMRIACYFDMEDIYGWLEKNGLGIFDKMCIDLILVSSGEMSARTVKSYIKRLEWIKKQLEQDGIPFPVDNSTLCLGAAADCKEDVFKYVVRHMYPADTSETILNNNRIFFVELAFFLIRLDRLALLVVLSHYLRKLGTALHETPLYLEEAIKWKAWACVRFFSQTQMKCNKPDILSDDWNILGEHPRNLGLILKCGVSLPEKSISDIYGMSFLHEDIAIGLLKSTLYKDNYVLWLSSMEEGRSLLIKVMDRRLF